MINHGLTMIHHFRAEAISKDQTCPAQVHGAQKLCGVGTLEVGSATVSLNVMGTVFMGFGKQQI